MKCFIIDRILSQDEVELLSQSKGTEIFYTADHLSNQVSNSEQISELTETDKKSINYDILNEILQISTLKYEGQPILEYLNIDHFNVWFYHKFRLYFDIRNACFEIEKIKKTELLFESVFVFTDSSFIKSFSGFISTTNVNYVASKAKLDKLSLFHFMLTSAFRLIKSWLNFTSYKNHKLIVDNRGHYKEMITVSGESDIFENSYLGYLFDKIGNKKIAVLDVLTIPKFDGKVPFRFKWNAIINHQNRKRIYEESILFKGFFNSNIRKQRKLDSSVLLDKLKSVSKIEGLNPVQKLIFWRLMDLHQSTKLYYFKHLAYKQFFQDKAFQMVASIDEYSANLKLIHDAAKSYNMESVGLQHGTMHELHPGYVYSKEEANCNPFPDKTIIWGERWKTFLQEKGNYPSATLVISGQIRADVIPNLINKKEEIREAIALPIKKVLLFASQPQRDLILRRQTATDIFQAVKDSSDVLLVLKPHPLEVDLTYFENIASTIGCTNYSIINDVDLYQLLAISDYVVTSFSTVGTEAVYFEKPLIIYDPLNQDVMKYIEDGVGIQAKNSIDLTSILEQLANGKIVMDKAVQEQFITNNAFKIDGNVCERIVKELL